MLKESLTVLGIGLGVVFFGLCCLVGIIYLMSFLVRLAKHEQRPSKHAHEVVTPVTQGFAPVTQGPLDAPRSPEKRRETVAAVSAAIAEYLGKDISGIRIHSVTRIGGGDQAMTPEQRREIVAVISAAIAQQLGADVSGIRIHSIRRV